MWNQGILRIDLINTPGWDAPRKISPERGFPQTKWALNCWNLTRGEETLLKSCSGSWQDLSMACQEQNPVGFFLSCSLSLSNTKRNRVLSSVGLFCRVPSNPTRNTQGCISQSHLHRALWEEFVNHGFQNWDSTSCLKIQPGQAGLEL